MSLRPHWLSIPVVLIPLTTMVSHAFGRSTYPLLLPAIIDDLSLSNSTAGLGGSLLFVSYLAGVVLTTAMAGRVEPTRTMKFGLAVTSLGLLIESFAPTIGLVFVGLSLAGMGGAAIWLTAPLLATENVSRERRGLVVGLVTGAVGLGTSLVALTTRAGRSVSGNENLWRPIFAIEAAFGLMVLLLIATFIKSSLKASSGGRPLSFDSIRQMPSWVAITAAYTLFGVISSGFASFLAEALESDGGLSRPTVSTVYLVLGIGAIIGAPLAGWASDHYGRRPIMAVVMVLIALVCAAVAFLDGTPLMIMVGALGGLWPTYPTLTATYVRDHVPESEFASTFGAMTILFSIAAVVPPAAAGRLADTTGSFTAAYLTFAVLAVGSAFIIAGNDSQPG